MNNPVAEIIDVFFNGRPANSPEPSGKQRVVVDLKKLVASRKPVHVTFEGKLYRITCERVEKI